MAITEGILFDSIMVGRKFKSAAEIVYRKVSKTSAIPIIDAAGKAISGGKKTTLFYGSNVLLTEVN